MLGRTTPPFRADHVGSLIRPEALIRAREAAEKNEIAPDELARIQHEAIRAIVRLQEDIGFKLATDGEYNRTFWQRDFLLKFENVRQVAAKLTVRFHSAARQGIPRHRRATARFRVAGANRCGGGSHQQNCW